MKIIRIIMSVMAVCLFTSKVSQAQFVVDVNNAGTIDEVFAYQRISDASSLTVRGTIDDRDLMMIRRLVSLNYLDLTQTNLRTLPSRALSNMRNLSTVLLPSSIRKIGNDALSGCISLINFDMPDGVESIGSGAFYGCRSLRSIDIVRNVQTIGDKAFEGCRMLAKVVIWSSPTIGRYAFSGCIGLEMVICVSVEPPQIQLDTFEGSSVNKILGVDAQNIASYQNNEAWSKQFSTIMSARGQ